jgi:hypothetical protein
MIDEQIQGSIAIAEFLGWKKDGELKHHYKVSPEWNKYWFIDQMYYRPAEMAFHRDFNWLTRVLFEIEKRGCIIETWISLACGCRILNPTNNPVVISAQEDNSLFDATFRAIVEYIEYEKQKDY